MRSQEEIELENMALAAELARQLCHEFSNFVYTLFLQIEIGAAAPASSKGENWAAIKRDGRDIVRLLREWDHFHGRFSFAETAVDLHQVIREMAAGAVAQERSVNLTPAISAGALTINGSAVDTRHLLRLLVEDLFREGEETSARVLAVSIETAVEEGKAVVRLATTRTFTSGGSDQDEESLMAAACRSLAVRLGAAIQRERTDDRCVVRVEFQMG